MTPYDSVEGGTPLNSTLITIANNAPIITSVILNSSDGTNITTANLTGFNISQSDADSDLIVNNYKWYKNNISNATRWINDSSLILYLPFDDNTTLDFARGNDGNAINGANGTPEGKINGGYMFDGANDRVNITNTGGDINITNIWTIGAWAKTRTTTTQGGVTRRIVTKENQFGMAMSDQISCRAGFNGGITVLVNSVSIDVWYHIMCVFNGTDIFLYVNGTLVNNGTDPLDSNSTNSILVGGRDTSGFFNGTIDEVAIWNRSLSASEIQQIYQGTRDGFAVLDSDQTGARGESWIIEMTPYDSVEGGTPLNSTLLTILDIPSPAPKGNELSGAAGAGGFSTPAEQTASVTSFMNQELCLQSADFDWFEDICYKCDGKISRSGEQLLCLSCAEGYNLVGKECEAINKKESDAIQKIRQLSLIDNYLNRFFPDNPLLGLIIIFFTAGIGIYGFVNRGALITRFKKGDKSWIKS